MIFLQLLKVLQRLLPTYLISNKTNCLPNETISLHVDLCTMTPEFFYENWMVACVPLNNNCKKNCICIHVPWLTIPEASIHKNRVNVEDVDLYCYPSRG